MKASSLVKRWNESSTNICIEDFYLGKCCQKQFFCCSLLFCFSSLYFSFSLTYYVCRPLYAKTNPLISFKKTFFIYSPFHLHYWEGCDTLLLIFSESNFLILLISCSHFSLFFFLQCGRMKPSDINHTMMMYCVALSKMYNVEAVLI